LPRSLALRGALAGPGGSGDSSPLMSPVGLRPPPPNTSLRRVPRATGPVHGVPADNIRGWDFVESFEVVLASTGHRGRVDARGRRGHVPAGLTRTTGLGTGAPSRVRRTRRLRRRGLGVALRRDSPGQRARRGADVGGRLPAAPHIGGREGNIRLPNCWPSASYGRSSKVRVSTRCTTPGHTLGFGKQCAFARLLTLPPCASNRSMTSTLRLRHRTRRSAWHGTRPRVAP
jgi:hypothetical protein